jgi:hypothetical protein
MRSRDVIFVSTVTFAGSHSRCAGEALIPHAAFPVPSLDWRFAGISLRDTVVVVLVCYCTCKECIQGSGHVLPIYGAIKQVATKVQYYVRTHLFVGKRNVTFQYTVYTPANDFGLLNRRLTYREPQVQNFFSDFLQALNTMIINFRTAIRPQCRHALPFPGRVPRKSRGTCIVNSFPLKFPFLCHHTSHGNRRPFSSISMNDVGLGDYENFEIKNNTFWIYPCFSVIQKFRFGTFPIEGLGGVWRKRPLQSQEKKDVWKYIRYVWTQLTIQLLKSKSVWVLSRMWHNLTILNCFQPFTSVHKTY